MAEPASAFPRIAERKGFILIDHQSTEAFSCLLLQPLQVTEVNGGKLLSETGYVYLFSNMFSVPDVLKFFRLYSAFFYKETGRILIEYQFK